MSENEIYDDAELQESLDRWVEEHADEVRASASSSEEIKITMSEGYQEYHDRLKNGFILIFTEFNLA